MDDLDGSLFEENNGDINGENGINEESGDKFPTEDLSQVEGSREEESVIIEPHDDLPEIPVLKSEKKDSVKKYVIILCAVCALVGGIIGGVISGVLVKNSVGGDDGGDNQAQVLAEEEKRDETTAAPTTQAQTSSEVTTVRSGTYTSSDDAPSLDLTFDARDIYKYNVNSVVSIEVEVSGGKGYGTGFIISEEGYVVTNYHVVENAKKVTVTLHDDRQYDAEVRGYEEANDIAVLKIDADDIQSLIYGVSSDLEVGAPVYIIGNPLGDLNFTLTTGVVSALNRIIETSTGTEINMFQTNAAINSGNSGGPVFDEHGYVVGIASAKYASASIEGLGFCIPIDDVRSMIDEIINKGYVSGKPSMGVSVYDRETATYGFIQSTRSINGAKIAAVGSGTAAEKAGLKVGDIITAVDSKSVTSVSSLKTILSNHRSGDTVSVTLTRNGEKIKATLTFDEYEPKESRTSYSNVYDL